MAVHGTLAAFNPREEDWSQYTERLSFYFTANGITGDAKKRAILLSSVGPPTFRLMRSLVLPESLDSFSYDDLVSKVKTHKEPAPSVIVRRFQFNTRNQKAGESIAEYIAVLRKAAEHCNYGDSLSEMIRDRLVCGITNTTVQKRLLAEKELSLDKAVSLAQSVEVAEQGAKDLQMAATAKSTTNADADLLKINAGPSNKHDDKNAHKSKPCYRCGGKHSPHLCRFKSECCHSCGKIGHIAKACLSRPQNKKSPATKSNKPVHNITETAENSAESEYQLFVIQNPSSNPLKTALLVEGQQLTMEIDTGAAISLVSEETVKSSHLKDVPLLPSDVTLRTYTGEAVSVLGKLMVKVDKDEATVTLPLVVVKGEGTTLQCRDWLQKLKLDWKTIFKLNSTTTLQQVLDCHKSVFSIKLGNFKKSKVKFYLTENAKP